MTSGTDFDRVAQACDTMADAEARGWRGSFGVEIAAYWYNLADDNDGIPEANLATFLRDANSAAAYLADNAEGEEYDPGEHALRRWEAAQQEG